MATGLMGRRGWNGLRRLVLLGLMAVSAVATPDAAQAASGFEVNGVLQLDQPLQPGDYAWDEAGIAGGRTTIVVDLSAQLLYVYRGGIEVGRTFIMYGDGDKPTPTGIFTILEKDADHVSNIYGAPMPYMLRLTWDGISIHGAEVDDEYATHGCVGIPEEFAAILFSRARIGDRVLITHDWMTDTYRGQV